MSAYVNSIADRLNGAGLASRGGVLEFIRQFGSADSRKAFDEWANHPVTVLVRRVVQDLAVNGPSYGVGTDMIPVHHGMTVAFGIMQQILDDPSLVFPTMFTGIGDVAAGTGSLPAETFDAPPDEDE